MKRTPLHIAAMNNSTEIVELFNKKRSRDKCNGYYISNYNIIFMIY